MPKDDYILLSDALKAILGVSIYDTIEELEGARTIAENTWADGLYDAYKIIEEEVDAADVAPVKHGRWKDYQTMIGDYLECPYCGAKFNTDHMLYAYRYCPNCGAKMDKEEEDV